MDIISIALVPAVAHKWLHLYLIHTELYYISFSATTELINKQIPKFHITSILLRNFTNNFHIKVNEVYTAHNHTVTTTYVT